MSGELKQILDNLKQDQNAKNIAYEFVKKDPVTVQTVPDPDFPYEIKDGHHRATLLKYLGFTTVPAFIK